MNQPVVGTSMTADGYALTGLSGPERTGITGEVSSQSPRPTASR